MKQFQYEVHVALKKNQTDAEGRIWVETQDPVLLHFNPNGMNGSKYFIYGNPKVFVCGIGKKDEIIEELGMTHEEKAFGKNKRAEA